MRPKEEEKGRKVVGTGIYSREMSERRSVKIYRGEVQQGEGS